MRQVLLIEDNPSDVFLVLEAIRTATTPADVTVACDGEQALRVLRHSHPDLIILDLNLPKRAGVEILKRRGDANLPVVVFTSSNRPEDRKRALALGAGEYITKPMTWEDYFGVIQSAMERWMLPEPTAPDGVTHDTEPFRHADAFARR